MSTGTSSPNRASSAGSESTSRTSGERLASRARNAASISSHRWQYRRLYSTNRSRPLAGAVLTLDRHEKVALPASHVQRERRVAVELREQLVELLRRPQLGRLALARHG